jgi:hypothetical protein
MLLAHCRWVTPLVPRACLQWMRWLRMSRKDTLRAWLAYRIKGATAEPHHGLIYAWTEREALEQAYAIFGCETEADRKRVNVQELK